MRWQEWKPAVDDLDRSSHLSEPVYSHMWAHTWDWENQSPIGNTQKCIWQTETPISSQEQRVLWDWRGKNFLGFLGGREGAGAESLSEHPSSYSPRGHLLEAVVGEGPLPCCLTPESCGKTTCWGWGRHQGTFSHTHTHTPSLKERAFPLSLPLPPTHPRLHST